MKDDKVLYWKWLRMRQKCNNPNNDDFYCYGGRGIIVCEEWDDFKTFKDWAINNGYNDELVLSRNTPKDDYSPETCSWITDLEHRAKKTKKLIDFNGETISLIELSKRTGISKSTLNSRLLQGCTGADLIRKPNHGLKVAI